MIKILLIYNIGKEHTALAPILLSADDIGERQFHEELDAVAARRKTQVSFHTTSIVFHNNMNTGIRTAFNLFQRKNDCQK